MTSLTDNNYPAFLNISNNVDHATQFQAIAKRLLNEYLICTLKAKYRLAEIEFYYINDPTSPEEENIPHTDYFTHAVFNQGKTGYWYLHTRGERLRQGTRKGIDLTIGNKEKGAFGGILFRAMQNIDDTNDYVYGPSLLIDRFIKECGQTKIDELESILNISAFSPANILRLEKAELNKEAVYSAHRHGLSIKDGSPQVIEAKKKFLHREYRYFIYPGKKHAGSEKIMDDWRESKKYTEAEILQIFKRKSFTKKS